jgi:predicted ATPase/ribosome-binding protein aMBF1 (putative translation factor)
MPALCGFATVAARHTGTSYAHKLDEQGEVEDGPDRVTKPPNVMEDEGRESIASDFGALLRRHRLALGLSQGALAERARLSLRGISALERGYRRSPQRETVALLAGALTLSAEQRRAFEAAAARPSLPRGKSKATVTVGPWPSAGSSNLPVALTRFFGRSVELKEIGALLRDHRFVTLTGAGGLGKTQAALHAAAGQRNLVESFCFVALAPIGNSSLVATAIASALGVKELSSRPLLETLVAYLKDKTLLLILDNCEHVIIEAAAVALELLSRCPRLRILATSREPLMAAGERAYRLPSLAVSDAIALFFDRAQAVDAHFRCTDANAPIAGEICRRLDGIPLAVELAAARVNVLSLRELVEKLDDRLRLLTVGDRTALPRQQTMRATIDWSYDLLTPPAQRLFERLSVFAGGCTIDATKAICSYEPLSEDSILDLMSSLVGKSLVLAELEGLQPRYRLLEPFREYAREKLEGRGEHPVVARRHAHAFLELAKRFSSARTSSALDGKWRATVRAELENCRAAVQWALIDGADIRLGQLLVSEFVTSWGDRSNRGDGSRWLTAAFDAVDERTPKSLLARLRYAEATFACRLENYELWLESSLKAMALYREIGDSQGFTRAQAFVGIALSNLGRTVEATPILEEALKGARKCGSPYQIGMILRYLAVTMFDGPTDLGAARDYLDEAASLFEAAGSKDILVWMKQELTDLALFSGDPELALQYATEMLTAAPNNEVDIGNHCTIHALHYMSTSLFALARYDEAEDCAREGLGLARDEQYDVQTAKALYNIAAAVAFRAETVAGYVRGAHARAARLVGFVDARLATIGSRLDHPEVYRRLVESLQRTLGADRVASLMAEGSALTEDQAVEEALAP